MLNKAHNRFAWILAIALLLPAGAQLASAQETPIKIAVVDLEFVFASSQAGKALQGKLEKLSNEAKAEIEKMAAEAQAIRKQVGDQGNSLSEERIQQLARQFDDKTQEIRRYQDDKQKEGEKMQNEGIRQIETQVQPILEALRTERSLDLILNNVPGVVVNVGPRIDITQEVIKRLTASQSGS
ncbi:MAG: OmpH family outer membrane protein [Deltaproteobacteria bacterium]|nr:OmpH family outer membrane protein [Deltaproteobacteria bacterium]